MVFWHNDYMESKVCSSCKALKPLDGFAINRKKRDGRDTFCKICKKAYNADYYGRTKERFSSVRAESRQRVLDERRDQLAAYLWEHPCVDCGETDIIVLQFDHQRDKAFSVAEMVMHRYRWERILAEIEKCEVVCANDHARRTARTYGWRKALIGLTLASSSG